MRAVFNCKEMLLVHHSKGHLSKKGVSDLCLQPHFS